MRALTIVLSLMLVFAAPAQARWTAARQYKWVHRGLYLPAVVLTVCAVAPIVLPALMIERLDSKLYRAAIEEREKAK